MAILTEVDIADDPPRLEGELASQSLMGGRRLVRLRMASEKPAVDRAEQLYGSLDEAQLRVIRAGVVASPFNPELWLLERQRRQRDVLQTLRRLQAERADVQQRTAALRGLVERTERSPNAEYRAYQVKLTDYNCALAAQIHNATTPAQRLKAREKLKGWEDDARSLISAV